MRKLVLFLMALIAVATFIRAYSNPEAVSSDMATASFSSVPVIR